MMRAYEMMIIIDGDVDDPQAQSWMKTVTEGLTAAGGELHGKIDWWGKRQFAYLINKKPSGYQIETADTWTTETRAALAQAQSLIEKTSKYAISKFYKEKAAYFEDSFRKSGSGSLCTRVDEDYAKKLLGYFKNRG